MNSYRDNIKKEFGGQAVNRYERVCALLTKYYNMYGKPDNRLIEIGCAATISAKYMNMFLKALPQEIRINKRNKAIQP